MSRRWMAVLAISLAVNLFFGGLVVGRWLASSSPVAERRGERGGMRSLQALPPDRRRVIRGELRRVAEESRPQAEAVRAARRAAASRFAQEPFDSAAVAADLARADQLELDLRRRVQAAILDEGARMTPAERAAVAPLLERGPRGLVRGGGRRESR